MGVQMEGGTGVLFLVAPSPRASEARVTRVEFDSGTGTATYNGDDPSCS